MKLIGTSDSKHLHQPKKGAHLAPGGRSKGRPIRCRSLYICLGLILLSCGLFVSTTCAWFMDQTAGATAQIQSGNLSMQLKIDNGYDLNDIPLHPVNCQVGEPNAIFETPLMHVENTGDLPLEYQLVLDTTGATGDVDLLSVISFDVVQENGSLFPASATLKPATESGSVTYFKVRATMQDNVSTVYQNKTISKPFRLNVIARQADENALWPDYCTEAKHNEHLNADGLPGITITHDTVQKCNMSYTCTSCGEVLREKVVDVQEHINQAAQQFDALTVGSEFVATDWTATGSDNTYTKAVTCECCHTNLGTLTVTTEEGTQKIETVTFDFNDPAILDLNKPAPDPTE